MGEVSQKLLITIIQSRNSSSTQCKWVIRINSPSNPIIIQYLASPRLSSSNSCVTSSSSHSSSTFSNLNSIKTTSQISIVIRAATRRRKSDQLKATLQQTKCALSHLKVLKLQVPIISIHTLANFQSIGKVLNSLNKSSHHLSPIKTRLGTRQTVWKRHEALSRCLNRIVRLMSRINYLFRPTKWKLTKLRQLANLLNNHHSSSTSTSS